MRRAGVAILAILAGMLMIRRRMTVVALARLLPVMVPAPRVRLNAMTARMSQGRILSCVKESGQSLG